ncbi:MAG: shikimate dehydrogenase [Acidobacteriota bacterium]
MNNGKICVSVFASTADALCEQIGRAEPLADVIELRIDHLDPSEIDKFLGSIPQIEKRYLFTYRPRSQGGPLEISLDERKAFWVKIHSKLRDFDYMIDLEEDLEMPADVDPERIIRSSHDFRSDAIDALGVFENLSNSAAGIIKIAQQADQITDAISVWSILDKAATSNKKVIPIAMGEAGKWTRILGLAHGSYLTYASLETGSETAPGQISAFDLRDLYRVKDLDADTGVYGIIAGDTTYSMSPYIHNPAFRALDINAVFVPLQISDLDAFMQRMVDPRAREVELNFKGFSVTNPHKQSVIKQLSWIDPDAAAIGAVNTVKVVDGKLHGYNTDAEGFVKPLIDVFGDLKNSRSAVVGTGGAARACVYMLTKHGSKVIVFGRDQERAHGLAAELGAAKAFLPATDFREYDIVVNATPLGTLGPNENKTIATAEQLTGTKLVYDLIYNPVETRLAVEAKIAGAAFIGGLEMLINQGVKQFEIWTGNDAPIDVMRSAVRRRLGI